MHNGEQKGKRVPHSSAAYYALQHCKSGRRSVGHSCSDVHGSATQLNGHTRLTSLEDVAAVDEETGGEIYFHDVLSNDQQEDPGTKAARKLDWQMFLASLSTRDQAVIQLYDRGRQQNINGQATRSLPFHDSAPEAQDSRKGRGVHGRRHPGPNPTPASMETEP
jgi:hypothetical protein